MNPNQVYVTKRSNRAKDLFPMPFKSKAQIRLLFAKEPEIAESFAEHTPKSAYTKLPEYVSRDKNRLKVLSKKHRRSKNA